MSIRSIHAADYLPERTRLYAVRDGRHVRFLGQVEVWRGVPGLWGHESGKDGAETAMLHEGEALEVDRKFGGLYGPRASVLPPTERPPEVFEPDYELMIEDALATRPLPMEFWR